MLPSRDGRAKGGFFWRPRGARATKVTRDDRSRFSLKASGGLDEGNQEDEDEEDGAESTQGFRGGFEEESLTQESLAESREGEREGVFEESRAPESDESETGEGREEREGRTQSDEESGEG
jgi:hypothetical protein